MVDDAKGASRVLPMPADGVLMSIDDAAAHLRTTPAAVRKLIEEDDGELGEALRGFIVKLSARRRYIARASFLAWLDKKAREATGTNLRAAGDAPRA